jgi:hypothetical protein
MAAPKSILEFAPAQDFAVFFICSRKSSDPIPTYPPGKMDRRTQM